ncbi:MAG: hypothetical protein IPM39_04615 [Chloroflexi bacterium]|nr:hypothetical protein [Chloroflexota bacterium]
MSNAQSVVRLQTHANRTPTGRASATAARKLAHYLAHGRGRPAEQSVRPQRGVWYGEDGRPLTHEQVLQWVAERGKTHPYTHQLILSVKEAQLEAAAYGRAMQAGGSDGNLFPEWRLVVHQDSHHSHAHVLAFGDEDIRVTGPTFRQWWLTVRQELEHSQQVYLAAQQREQAMELVIPVPQQAAVQELTRQWEMEL